MQKRKNWKGTWWGYIEGVSEIRNVAHGSELDIKNVTRDSVSEIRNVAHGSVISLPMSENARDQKMMNI